GARPTKGLRDAAPGAPVFGNTLRNFAICGFPVEWNRASAAPLRWIYPLPWILTSGPTPQDRPRRRGLGMTIEGIGESQDSRTPIFFAVTVIHAPVWPTMSGSIMASKLAPSFRLPL